MKCDNCGVENPPSGTYDGICAACFWARALFVEVDTSETIADLIAAPWRKVLPPTPIDEIEDRMLLDTCCPN